MALPSKNLHEGHQTPEYQYTAVFEPAAEGGYIVTVPVFPGLITEGATLEEARAMVHDALQVYLDVLTEHGEEIGDVLTVVEI